MKADVTYVRKPILKLVTKIQQVKTMAKK